MDNLHDTDQCCGLVTTKMHFFLLRILKDKRQEKELFVLQQATLKEGEMWGLNMPDIDNWIGHNGKLKITVIIYTLKF
mgnify:FL=1